MIQAVNEAVRLLISTQLGIPGANVRPARQDGPTGGQVTEVVYVDVMASAPEGQPETHLEPDGLGGWNEANYVPYTVTAHLQFFRRVASAVAPVNPDRARIATYNTTAIDRAARLDQLLWLAPAREQLASMGLALMDVGRATDTSAIADGTWSSRALVALTLAVHNREALPAVIVTSASVGLFVQQPDGVIQTRDIEVTTP